ncbi:MAG TPA: LysR family transcriptional regulator [Polyangiaceae bacterium]
MAFDALVRETNVTRAAQTVGITQSAMSHALRRLRELLDDPLLVRGKGGMLLTPRAEALAVPVRSGLLTLARALEQPPLFEAASATRRFCVASPDLFDVLAVPSLLERIRREAPGVDIAVQSANDPRLRERLETGDIDVAVVPRMDGPNGDAAPDTGLLQRTLFRDRFICLMRADHPAFQMSASRRRSSATRRSLSLELYAQLSHVMVSQTGEGTSLVDRMLEARGLTRRIALRIPHFYSALAIVAKSDLILTAPSALAQVAPAKLPVVALAPPLALPRHSVNLLWHQRFSSDPGHAWLRGVMLDVARTVHRAP